MTQSNSVGKIYNYPNGDRLYMAQITAAYAGVEVEFQATDMEKAKSSEFMSKFPYGRVPAMDTQDGPLYECAAIAHYIALKGKNPALLGTSEYEKALVTKYISIGNMDIEGSLGLRNLMYLGYAPYNKEAEKTCVENYTRALKVLDVELSTRTFLVGERVSLADIVVCCLLLRGYQKYFDESFRSSIPNVTRWFLTMVNQPKVKNVIGEVKLCVQPAKYEKKAAPAAAAAPAKKDKKKKDDAFEDDAGDDLVPQEEKKKSVLDSLPPSTFIMDAWKRFYSNNEPPQSSKFFQDNFDPEGFSMWKCEYKYNDELTQIFMSSNLIGGFFHRLERARKYAFGSMIVTGENNNNKISGMWIFRGQVVPEEVTDAADYESYAFTKVNVGGKVGALEISAEDKQLWDEYLAWEGAHLPGKFADGKIFK
ncbi:hypothetical protein MIR68_010742 [Amoeboaphelidium protococcarum]|nr:hypothetical protein MIR68_010742 [Amoeboaphelidium protococcarum]